MYSLADYLGQPLSTIYAMTVDEFNHWFTFIKLKREKEDGSRNRSNSAKR
jgi:hypothetical protein